MSIKDLKPAQLKRYLEIAAVVMRHGGREWLPGDTRAELGGIEHSDSASGDADLARDLEALGPVFIKLGQLLSTRPDIVPGEYVTQLQRLRSGVEPFPASVAREIFEQQIGVPVSRAFAGFDDEPFAAASLSQVHRARLRDGSDVVVKVQRPDLDKALSRDLDALEALASLAARCSEDARCLDLPGVVRQLRASLLRELDFDNERANLKHFRSFFADYPNIVVPAPVDDFSSARVLTMEYLPGTAITDLSPVVNTELDGAGLAREFFDAYLQQVLVEGIFHADPHPGNVLVTPDRRIGILDFGMVGRFGTLQQRSLTKLLLAIGDCDGGGAARVAEELGYATQTFDRNRFEAAISELVIGNKNRKIEDQSFGLIVMEICRIATSFGLRLPHELTLLGKTLLNLDQFAVALDPEFNPYATIRSNAAKIIQGRIDNESLPSRLYASFADTRELAEKLPRKLSKILDTVAQNRISLTIEMAEIRRLTDTLRSLANRISVGIILASLIIGAALLMRVETEFTLFGYPGLAIVLFLAAAAGGLWFALSVIIGDSRSTRSH
ncbi:MAG: AarF/ABC1/UbiB kinase family protein [Woeseiaceae bacterium]|nr:AarF/ABC1/UbiB kinase family protein [Woeseiaceae bacterium]